MGNSVIDIKLIGQDLASGVINKVRGGIEDMASDMKTKLTSGFSKIASVLKVGLAATGAGVVAMGGFMAKGAIDQAKQFETYEATLKTMLGTTAKAKARLQEYAEIGKKTPFELDQVVALGNSLQAIGKYSQKTVMDLGDLAAAAGKPIEQVSNAYAKLATGQKGSAVMMFQDLLISAKDWQAATGKGISKNGELMASTEEMMAALPKIMKNKGFSGMMDEQSKTLAGKWSNLMDTINGKLRELGEKMLPVIKPAVDAVISLIDGVNVDALIQGAINGFTSLNATLQPMIQFIINNKDAVVFSLSAIALTITATLIPSLVALVTTAAPVILAIAAIGAASFLLYQGWTSNWGGMRDIITDLWSNNILPVLQKVQEWLQVVIPAAVEFIKPIFGSFGDSITESWGQISEGLSTYWEAIKEVWNSLQPLLGLIVKVFAYNFGIILMGAVGLVNGIIRAFGGLMEFLGGAIRVIAGILDIITGMFTGNNDKIMQGLGKVVGGIESMLKGALNIVIGLVNGFVDGINNVAIEAINKIPGVNLPKIGHIPGLATGTNRVPSDMLAMIHKDEAVVPAKYNPASPTYEGGGKSVNIEKIEQNFYYPMTQEAAMNGLSFKINNLNLV